MVLNTLKEIAISSAASESIAGTWEVHTLYRSTGHG